MREVKVFSLPFNTEHGFDDTPLQTWLQAGREVIKQENHLINQDHRHFLILIVETQSIQDPWRKPAPPSSTAQHKRKQRQEQRKKLNADYEAALARLDETGRALHDILKNWRTAQSELHGLASYEFGTNLLLCEIAQRRPRTLQELESLEHVKPKFLKMAGVDVLELINQQAMLTSGLDPS